MEPKLMNCCRPEQVGTEVHGQDVETNSDSRRITRTHEENFLSSWLREDEKRKTKREMEVDKEVMILVCCFLSWWRWWVCACGY